MLCAKDLRAKVRKECKRLHVNESDFAPRLANISCANFHSRMDGATPRAKVIAILGKCVGQLRPWMSRLKGELESKLSLSSCSAWMV